MQPVSRGCSAGRRLEVERFSREPSRGIRGIGRLCNLCAARDPRLNFPLLPSYRRDHCTFSSSRRIRTLSLFLYIYLIARMVTKHSVLGDRVERRKGGGDKMLQGQVTVRRGKRKSVNAR